jgi:hypothetical protein
MLLAGPKNSFKPTPLRGGLTQALALRGFQIELISFVAKWLHASGSNILGRVQLENCREAKRFKSAAASFPANAAFCSVGNHC